jgi:hypothetical protein
LCFACGRAYLLNLRQFGISPLSDEEKVTRYLSELDTDLAHTNSHLRTYDSPLFEVRVIYQDRLQTVQSGELPESANLINRVRLTQLEQMYHEWFKMVERELPARPAN